MSALRHREPPGSRLLPQLRAATGCRWGCDDARAPRRATGDAGLPALRNDQLGRRGLLPELWREPARQRAAGTRLRSTRRPKHTAAGRGLGTRGSIGRRGVGTACPAGRGGRDRHGLGAALRLWRRLALATKLRRKRRIRGRVLEWV